MAHLMYSLVLVLQQLFVELFAEGVVEDLEAVFE